MDFDRSVDIRGLCCAQPIIRLGQELKGMRPGEVLLARADKTSLLKDIPVFCQQTRNPLVHQDEEDGVLRFWIRKA